MQSYELFSNGSYSSLLTNGTATTFEMQVITNKTANASHVWVNTAGTLDAHWSPAYWTDFDTDSGTGFYWSGSAWVFASYSLYPIEDEPIIIDPEEPVLPDTNTTYNYLNVSGSGVFTYSLAQGGWHQYKNPNQTNSTQAYMNTRYDDICDSRNQIIIIGDSRIPAAMYGTTNVKHAVADSKPRVATLEQQTVPFVPLI